MEEATTADKRRKNIDWESIEKDYRIGAQSVRSLANEFGVSEGMIRKRALAEEWSRDLSAPTRARAAVKVREALRAESAQKLVRTELVRSEMVRSEMVRTPKGTHRDSEREAIDFEAEIQSRTELKHRASIVRASGIVDRMLLQLESGIEEGELPENTRIAKSLVDSLKTLVELERRVLRMDEFSAANGDNSITVQYVGA